MLTGAEYIHMAICDVLWPWSRGAIIISENVGYI
jgi:hypothetical protein